MELKVLLLLGLTASVRSIIVSDPVPLTYSLAGGYASQYPLSAQHPYQEHQNILQYTKLPQYARTDPGRQQPSNYPTVHHPAEFTFASPPVRHAEPINYPLPPAPVKEEVNEPSRLPEFVTYTLPSGSLPYPAAHNSLLGVAYSPASAVSRMSFSNGYGVSYGY